MPLPNGKYAEGTGVLWNSNTILTAGHNLLEGKRKYFEKVEIEFSPELNIPRTTVKKTQFHVPQMFYETTRAKYDIGMIRLSQRMVNFTDVDLEYPPNKMRRACKTEGFKFNSSELTSANIKARKPWYRPFIYGSSDIPLDHGMSGSPLYVIENNTLKILGVFIGIQSGKYAFVPLRKNLML